MIDQLNQLITDQTILAMLPIVTLGIIAAIGGFYSIWRQRRESREPDASGKPCRP